MTPRRVAGLAVLGLVLWTFHAAVFQGRVFFFRDIGLVWVPQVEAFVRAVGHGSWPTWDPLSAFGQPLLADPSAQVLYPFTWLNLLMQPWTYYTVFVVAHAWFSGIGAYLLGRRWGMSPAAALVAAGAWVMGGPLLSYANLWHHFAGACWIPWVFLAGEAALERERRAGVLAWGAALGGQALAGSADMLAMTALAMAGYVIVCRLEWRRPLGAENLRILLRGAAAALLGAGLSAGLWLPALDVVSRAARPVLVYEARTFWSLHPWALLDLVFPGVWRPFAPQPRPEHLRELREPFLESLYLGVPLLGLVGAGLSRRSGTDSRTLFLALLGAAALLFALGRHTPVYGIAATLLPPLRVFRYPVKAMILAGFSWAMLAGAGFDAARSGAPRRRFLLLAVAPLAAVALAAWAGLALARVHPQAFKPRPWAFQTPPPAEDVLAMTVRTLAWTGSLAMAALALALAGLARRTRSWTGPGLAILALADFALFHHYLGLAPKEFFNYRPEALPVLAAAGAQRVYVYDYLTPGESGRRIGTAHKLARMPAGWSDREASALGLQMALAWATPGRWNLRTGYDIDLRGLHSRELLHLSRFLGLVEGRPVHLKLLQMGAVTHAVSLHPLDGLEPVAVLPGLFVHPIHVLRVPDPLPRTYVMAETRVLDEHGAYARMLEPAWDPRREVILSGGEPRTSPPSFAGSARILSEGPDRVSVEAEANDAGYLVLVDSYDPGWRATVDGHAASVLRANLAFRAVPLPPGRHVVEFRYQPPSLIAGALTCGACALGMVVAAVISWRRRHPFHPEPDAPGAVPGSPAGGL